MNAFWTALTHEDRAAAHHFYRGFHAWFHCHRKIDHAREGGLRRRELVLHFSGVRLHHPIIAPLPRCLDGEIARRFCDAAVDRIEDGTSKD